ncbi:BCCT family transporter [Roseovarius sp. S4756]|uniref:BCCT family transporter n=1 Tax=Roseovarius maritimus TaxID=3342637 RepID=UPI00372B7E71
MLDTLRPDLVAAVLSGVRSATGPTLGWYYVLHVTVMLAIVRWLGLGYQRNRWLITRSALYLLIGKRIYGWRGDLVNTFAVVSTVSGIATTLGLGAPRMNARLHWLTDIDNLIGHQVTIILFITVLAIFSFASGVRRGGWWLSWASLVEMVIARI